MTLLATNLHCIGIHSPRIHAGLLFQILPLVSIKLHSQEPEGNISPCPFSLYLTDSLLLDAASDLRPRFNT